MLKGYIFVFVFAVTISIDSFTPAPLDDLTININLNEEPKGKRYGQSWEDYGLDINAKNPDLSKCHTTSKKAISSAVKRAMMTLDVGAVKRDIKELLTDSKDIWPADYGNYGPLLVRQAWHSAGTYRLSDGRGGVGGGRQRFDPEKSWEDNTNLDKARGLLERVKMKYGDGLSYGDLYVLSGNVAIESMGGPILGFCGGRIDDVDGSESTLLGPTPEQEELFPCEEEGNCQLPLGTGQLELIYVNPEGPKGDPDPVKSAKNIRDVFGRMGLNDSETVALIGGGHAFGKVHGPCTPMQGRNHLVAPMHLVPRPMVHQSCIDGKGINAYTSGFEFPWTTKPTKWDNEFFQNLVNFKFEKSKGPGGHWEWKAAGNKRPQAPMADGNGMQDTGMLTADVSLKHDDKYWDLVQKWAGDQSSFDHDFMYAWYKLTTRDMGPRSRCIGNDIPPALPFQYPLPESSSLPIESAIDSVKSDLQNFLESEGDDLQGLLIRLAWQCSATYRATDFQGGCNGARIRFSPQKDWPINDGLDLAINKLKFIKYKYGDSLSWSDLIILAGYEAIKQSGGLSMKFCPGRSDATKEDGMSENLKTTGHMFKDLCTFIDLMDLTNKEYSVLHAAAYAIGQKLPRGDPVKGLFGRRDGSQTDGKLSNIFFKRIISQYKSEVGNDMNELDLLFAVNKDLKNIAQIYANNNQLFLVDFAAAWTKVSNMGSFDGPFGNMCDTNKGRFQ